MSLRGMQKSQGLLKAKDEEVGISPEDRAFFRGLQNLIHVPAAGEGWRPWRPDVYNNLPEMAGGSPR
jgi:hypothetical protein